MVSGFVSAKTVSHFCPAAATSSCGPAAAGCTEMLNTSSTALIQRRDCIMSSLVLADIPRTREDMMQSRLWISAVLLVLSISVQPAAAGPQEDVAAAGQKWDTVFADT